MSNLRNSINVNEIASISYEYDAKGNCTRENVSLIENNISLIGTMRKEYENNRLSKIIYFTYSAIDLNIIIEFLVE